MITFKARHINSVPIQQKQQKQSASFVELKQNDFNDMRTINLAVLDWNSPYKIIDDIATSINESYIQDKEKPNYFFYALTTQNKNFEDILRGTVKGVIGVHKENNSTLYIDSFEVAPSCSYNAIEPQYKNVGTAILNSIKALFKDLEIFVRSEPSAIKFYEKNGFELVGNRTLMKLIRR